MSRRATKILTFNWHVPYLCLMARTGHEFFVVEPETTSGRRRWDHEMRPPPENVRVLDDRTWRRGLEENVFDLVVCHNHMDLVSVLSYPAPKILVLHNRLSTSLAMGDGLDKRPTFWENIFLPLYQSAGHVRFVAISAAKKADWGLPARVIMPGVDPDEFNGYRGDDACVLRIGNYLKERDLMMGFTQQEAIVGDLPSTVLGINPTVPGSRLSENFDDLREQYRGHRVYLNTTVDPWEDGYNLAMLEAMATGMPVVTTANSTSPIVDGLNGYVSADTDELHERLTHLLDDRPLAQRLGAEARHTAIEQFPISRFVEDWNDMIADTLRANRQCRRVKKLGTAHVRRRRVLMAYTANPTTTAAYLDRALRQDHEVVTCGPTISDEVLDKWDMMAVKNLVRQHDVHLDVDLDMRTVFDRLPEGFTPELFIWVESGINFMPPDMHLIECPKAGYFIDSHINLEWHIEWARQFDHVFVAQRAYVDAFRRAGCRSVHWLPLACDPDVHRLLEGPQRVEKTYDIGFVGSITPQNPRRRQLLGLLGKEMSVHTDRCFLDEMAAVFNRSRIVFNTALRDDINMRVFEALGCGAMLLTDEAISSGLDDLFKHDIHLAVYSDDSLPATARYYLDRPDKRERIAVEGRHEVLEYHTYRHRARQMLRTVFEGAVDHDELDIAGLVRHVPQTGSRILVAGRGAPDVALALKDIGFGHVAGIEPDIEFATDRTRTVFDEIIEWPAAGSSSDAAPFDAVVLVNMLERCERPGQTMAALKPLLAPGGRVVINVHNARFLGYIEELVEGRWLTADQLRAIPRPMTLSDINVLLVRAGLEAENIVAVGSSGDRISRGRVAFGRIWIDSPSEADVRELEAARLIITAVATSDESISRAEQAYRHKQYDEALGHLARPLSSAVTATHTAHASVLRGRCLEALGDWHAAEAAYQAALDETETAGAAILGLARVALERDDTHGAVTLVERTQQTELSSADRVDRGRLRLRLGNAARAASDFRSVLDQHAADRDAVRGLIEAARMQADLEPALPYIDRYLGLRGADVGTLYDAALLDSELGRIEVAIDRLETALMLEPQHADARRLLDQLRG